MPIYGYHCDSCAHEFEILQRMSADPLKECPECGGRLRKLLYPVGVQFKGSGFYTTDYRDGGNGKPDAKSDGKAEAKPESKTEAKTDGKPEAKSTDKGETKAASSSTKTETKDSGSAKKER